MDPKPNKFEWQDKADQLAEQAAKTFPVTGTARDAIEWFHRNRAATYKRLIQVAYQAFGLK